MRRAAKVDDNHKEVVRFLQAHGHLVQSLGQVGNGAPDLLVWPAAKVRGRALVLLEVKDGRKPPSQRKLTPLQAKWHADWRGAPVYVVECAEDALAVVEGRSLR